MESELHDSVGRFAGQASHQAGSQVQRHLRAFRDRLETCRTLWSCRVADHFDFGAASHEVVSKLISQADS
jgi:hypothetical protein